MPRKEIQKETVKVYHGTTEAIAKLACARGLSLYNPGDTLDGLPRNICGSTEEGICLTSVYPGLMAFDTTSNRQDRWGIIEIDLSQLDTNFFMPFEGFLAENSKSKFIDEESRVNKLIKSRQARNANHKKWRESLDNYGICVYGSKIPVSAISKVTIYDPNSNWVITKASLSVILGSRFHASFQKRHQMVTKWLAGSEITAEHWVGPAFSKLTHPEKDKIVQVLHNKNGLDIFYQISNGKRQ